jgi:glycosyltransferase involved in cell wall biosynthesis
MKISIVTPNYNYGHFIEATLRSVVNQEYAELEYIVLDDGSDDDSVATIRKYADRVAHWETAANQGQYKTITRGFAMSTGEILGWLNSDDMHLPWTLRAVNDIFSNFPEVQWLSTLHLGHWDWAGYCLGFFPSLGYARHAFLDGRYLPPEAADPRGVPPQNREFIQQESTFWRRSLWEKAGGYVSHEFGSAGDFELWARFYRHAELVGVDIPLAGFRHQQQQQSAQRERYAGYCTPALEAYRREANWSPSLVRSVAHGAKALPIPHPRTTPGLRALGYTGKRLVRRSPETPQAHWDLESYSFL